MTKHKVHFFKIDLFNEENAEIKTEFEDVCKEVVNLEIAKKSLKMSDSISYRLTYFKAHGDHYRGKIVKYRNNHMIMGSLNDDELEDLMLDEGKKFTEVTHFVYSPSTKILTFEYSQNGPRHAMFLGYLFTIQRSYKTDPIRFTGDLLMHPDVLRELNSDVERIKSLTVGLPVAKLHSSMQQNNLVEGLKAASKFANTGQIYIKLVGARKHGDKTPLISTNEIVRAISDNEIDLGLYGKAEVEVVNEFGDATINLLENKLEATKEWDVPITSENAERWFDDIAALYQANHPVLIEAVNETA
ncbi:MAG TPA: hypothetical protein VLA88_05695 [Candidatus Saccharimonadales bacterium]|nr:hypothetical protein [Candidatus Saccharimonadales bacterium]